MIDADAIRYFTGELDQELLSSLAWVVLDRVEIFKGQLFAFEDNSHSAFIEYLSFHGFD